MKGLTRRGLTAICVGAAAAGGGYLLAAQAPAGAASPADRTSGSSSTPTACSVPRETGVDAAASAAKRRDVEQLAQALGVSLDRLGQATIVLKQAGIPPSDPRAGGMLAQQLGLDPAVVRSALAQLMREYPFNQADATGSRAASAPGPAVGKSGDAGGCAAEVRPADADNPKIVALRGLARTLNVSVSRLMNGFGAAEAHGVGTVDDPRMPAALAQALGLDPSTVQQAVAVMRSRPPFDHAADCASAAGTRK
jgi:hypothetical protein